MEPVAPPRTTLTLLTLGLGLLIALTEIDRLIRMVPSGPEGFALGLGEVSAPRVPLPLPDSTSQPWLAIHQLGAGSDFRAQGELLVGLWLGLDVLLALTYGLLLWLLLRRLVARGAVPESAPLRLLTTPRPWMAWATAGLDVVENLLLAILVLGPATTEPSTALVGCVAVVTFAKWVALLAAVGQLLYGVVATPEGRAWLSSRSQAIYAQRFSALAFAPLAVLALVPGSGMLDQLPDIQRTWFAEREAQHSGVLPGWWHALVASALLLAVTFGLVLLGRLMADNVARRVEGAGAQLFRPAPALRQWMFGPALVLVLLVWVTVLGTAPVRWGWLLAFVGVPLAIVAVSAHLRARFPGYAAPEPRTYDAATAAQVRRLGDVLALSGMAAGALGLVRSHVVLLALWEGTALQRAIPAAALAAAIAVWWVGPWVIERLASLPWVGGLFTPGEGTSTMVSEGGTNAWGQPVDPGPRFLWWLAWALIWASTVALVALVAWPVRWSAALGVIGVVMLALGALMLLIGSSVVLHQFYAPPQIFWPSPLRLREAPVALLLVTVVAVALVPGSNQQVHGLRDALPSGAPTTTPSPVDEVVTAWAERTDACTITTPEGPARPMILVAAEGGGIRAAYWTAAALREIRDHTPCGLAPVVLASGVSGGSVGLATSRFATDQEAAVDQVWTMSGPDALAQGSLGLLLRDPLYTVTGLAAGSDTQEDGWLDRAALMELAWESAAPGLGDDFLAPPRDRSEGELEAPLVLNSAATSSGCRVLVSQVALGSGTLSDCADPGAPLAYSRDFYADYGHRTDDPDDTCIGAITAATASMTSARFPFVTPSGVVGPCRGAPEAQLIDGGYAEGSGLGTLVDLAPRLLEEASSRADLPVVPIVVYLDNGRGSDLVQPPPEAVAEILVPLVGNANAAGTQQAVPALLQRAHGLTSPFNAGEPTVYVVTQPSRPAVEAPLGWVLSPASRADMDRSLTRGVEQARVRCVAGLLDADLATPDEPELYPGLPELLAVLGDCR